MLESWIVEKILQKEQEDQAQQQLPLEPEEAAEYTYTEPQLVPLPKTERGVVVIDY